MTDNESILQRSTAVDSAGFLDRLVPSEARTTAEGQRRARLFIVIVGVLTAASLFFAQQASLTPNSTAVVITLGVGGLLGLSNLPLAWMTRSIQLPSLLLCIQHVVVVTLCASVGSGVRDPSLWWLAPAPLVASFLLGPRAGIAAAIAASGGVIGLYAAAAGGYAFEALGEDNAFFEMLGAVTVFAGLAAIAWMYESSRQRSLVLIEQALRELRTVNREAARANLELAAARDHALDENRRKSAFLEEMRGAGLLQQEALSRTRVATERMAETIRAIAASSETLAQAAAASNQATHDMDGTAQRVSATSATLLDAVGNTDRALRGVRDAVAAFSSQLDELRRSSQETSAAMLEVARATQNVEESAANTAALAQGVIQDAERGFEAVRRTRDGMLHIRASSRTSSEAIRGLARRAEEIGRILGVIDEVAAETGVLALNASIIAAQAGESGKGFAVVAEQIKALAERTGRSTKEIANVVVSVQHEARNAASSILKGEEAVDTGFTLSEDAARALELIVQSARSTTNMVKAIDDATNVQAARAQRVGSAMLEVARNIQSAVDTTAEQNRALQLIEQAMARVRGLTPQLERETHVQAEGARALRDAAARIGDMAHRLNDVQADQASASEQTVRAVDSLQRAQSEQVQALERLS